MTAGRTDIGAIAAFMISYERLVFPLGNLVNQWAVLQNTLAHARRVLEMVNPNAPLKKVSPQMEELPGDIVFDRVHQGTVWVHDGYPEWMGHFGCNRELSGEVQTG